MPLPPGRRDVTCDERIRGAVRCDRARPVRPLGARTGWKVLRDRDSACVVRNSRAPRQVWAPGSSWAFRCRIWPSCCSSPRPAVLSVLRSGTQRDAERLRCSDGPGSAGPTEPKRGVARSGARRRRREAGVAVRRRTPLCAAAFAPPCERRRNCRESCDLRRGVRVIRIRACAAPQRWPVQPDRLPARRRRRCTPGRSSLRMGTVCRVARTPDARHL